MASDTHEARIEELRRTRGWPAVLAYCLRADRDLRAAIRTEGMRPGLLEERLAVLSGMVDAHLQLGNLQGARRTLETRVSLLRRRQPYDAVATHFALLVLARVCGQLGMMAEAHRAAARSLTALLTRQQSELLGGALLDGVIAGLLAGEEGRRHLGGLGAEIREESVHVHRPGAQRS